MNAFFARVTTGLEELALSEIEEAGGVGEGPPKKRTVNFSFNGDLSSLAGLRSVDDLFVYVGDLHGINRTRASLSLLESVVASLQFSSAIDLCREIRPVPSHPTFTITSSLAGKRNYSRYEVAERISGTLEKKIGGKYLAQKPGLPLQDLDIRFLMEEDTVRVGIRFGRLPLHRRKYKLHNLPGSLKPPVAYAMCRLAELASHHTLLDTMCGAGTIPIEACLAYHCQQIIGLDLNPSSIESALKNQMIAGTSVKFLQGDARELKFKAHSIDRIITNLPWGKQVRADEGIEALYRLVFREFEEVLKPGGKLVVLTDQLEMINELSAKSIRLSFNRSVSISLYGSHPSIFVLNVRE